jgi:hypothetical protein
MKSRLLGVVKKDVGRLIALGLTESLNVIGHQSVQIKLLI